MTDTVAADQRQAKIREELRLRPPPPRVVRLSRKALITLGATASIALSAALYWALRSSAPPDPLPELVSTVTRPPSESLSGLPKDYTGVPKLGPPLPGDLGRPLLNAGVTPPAPSAAAAVPAPDPVASARVRAEQARDAARASRLFAAEARAALATQAPSVPSGAETPARPEPADRRRAFLERSDTRSTVASDRLALPPSPYLVPAGAIIPAALITGIRADLPGQITAQVTTAVRGGPTGRTVLIPQGAKLIGEYDSEIRSGERRALIVWTRLILPDGRSLSLDREPGTDASGYAGLEDRVDNHWGEIVKAALVSTLLAIGTQTGTSAEEDTLVRALRRGASDGIAQAGQQVVGRSLAIAPTLTIRPGMPVRVIVTRDLVLEP